MKTAPHHRKLHHSLKQKTPTGFKISPVFLLPLFFVLAGSRAHAASPVVSNLTAPSVANQAVGTRFLVPGLKGTDAEDGVLGGPTSKLKIIALPGTATLYYNSVAVTANQTITNYDSTALTFSPTTTAAGTVSFTFTFVDANNNDGNTATATLPLTQLGFPCDGQLKFTRQITIGGATATVLSYPLFDYATGNFNTKNIDTFLNKDFNASVYYNGYVYAFKQSATVGIYELHPDGTSTQITTTGVSLPTSSWNNAGVDRNGVMYAMNPGSFTLYKIDLKTKVISTATCTGIADGATNAIYGDMVMDPETSTMYVWYHPTTAGTHPGLYSLNLTTNVFTLIGAVNQTMGSLMYDNFDRLFAYGSPTPVGSSQDRLWMVDKSNAAAVQVGVADIQISQSDGSSCSFKFSCGLTAGTPCIKAGATFNYTAFISNYTNYVPKSAYFRDTLDNRFSFSTAAGTLQTTLRAIYGNAATVAYSNYNGGTNNVLTVSNMSINNLEKNSFDLGVTVSSGATFTNGETIDNFAYVTNVVGYNGGVERSTDQNKNTPNSPARVYAYLPATAVVTAPLGNCTATLTATPSSGVAYQWSNTGGNIAGATSATYATSTPATYTVTTSITVVDTAKCYSTASVVVNPCVSGTVFNDVNGISNSLIDGAGTNAGGTLYASLVSGNTVLNTVPVALDGTYAFPNTAPANYTVLISTTNYTTGATNPVASVPAGYVNTSEAISPAFNDATPANGIIAVTVAATNVSGVNFGIERTPTATAASYTIPQPVGHSTKTLTAGNSMGSLAGNDIDDGAYGSGSHVVITSLASMNGNELYYQGSKVTAGFDIPTYNPSNLSVKFQGSHSLNATFAFAFVDAAGKVGASADYKISWATPLPVELISFDGTAKECTATITWKSAVEKAAANFEVMRSEDGASFTSVAIETAKGDNSTYQVTVVNESNAFFKLKMNDLNGNYAYSASIRVNTQCSGPVRIGLSPNPATSLLKLTGIEPGSTIAVLDMYGRKVLEIIAVQSNMLDVSSLIPGNYHVHITKTGQLIGNLRFVKQ